MQSVTMTEEAPNETSVAKLSGTSRGILSSEKKDARNRSGLSLNIPLLRAVEPIQRVATIVMKQAERNMTLFFGKKRRREVDMLVLDKANNVE